MWDTCVQEKAEEIVKMIERLNDGATGNPDTVQFSATFAWNVVNLNVPKLVYVDGGLWSTLFH